MNVQVEEVLKVSTEKEKPDIVEVTDEIVRTSRYGRRNYRNSVGADNRRHWHGEFLIREEHRIEKHGKAKKVESEEAEEETKEIEIKPEDKGNIAEPQYAEDEQESEGPSEAEFTQFFDPLANDQEDILTLTTDDIVGDSDDEEPEAEDTAEPDRFILSDDEEPQDAVERP